MNKPFKPLTLNRPGQSHATSSHQTKQETIERIPSTPPPAKKRKVIHIEDTPEEKKSTLQSLPAKISASARPPLLALNVESASQKSGSVGTEAYYAVLW